MTIPSVADDPGRIDPGQQDGDPLVELLGLVGHGQGQASLEGDVGEIGVVEVAGPEGERLRRGVEQLVGLGPTASWRNAGGKSSECLGSLRGA